jgi:predicted DNA binding CopG/RHH family protein
MNHMRAHYDFSKLKRRGNPYPARLKKAITIRLDVFTISYFKEMAEEVGMPYQNLINLYLRDCAQTRKKITLKWVP